MTTQHTDAHMIDADDVPTVRVPGSFESFYDREFSGLVRLAYARSGSRLAAEDIVQDAMVAAHRQWDVVGLLDRPGAWVRRAVLNRSTSWYHRRRAEARAIARLAPLRSTPPARLDSESDHIWRVVRRLPRRQAEAVALFYVDDMSVADIALVMDCSPNTVKAHLHQARQTLALEIDNGGESE